MTISVDRVGDRIHLRSPYSDRNLALAKSIGGANFSKKAQAWTYPLSMDHCRALRRAFGRELKVGAALGEWARQQVAAEKALGDLGARTDGVQLQRLPKRYPATYEALASRPYQSVGALYVAQGGAVLVGDTPGLGKTLEAIAGIVESGAPGPYLIVAPKTSIRSVWEREILRWAPDASVWVMPEGKAARDAWLTEAVDPYWDLRNTWVVINIEMVRTISWWVCEKRHCLDECELDHDHEKSTERWKVSDRPRSQIIDCEHDPRKVKTFHEHKFPQLFGLEWGAIVADESQRSLIRTSGTPTQTRNGMRLLRSRGTPETWMRIALSGTPMRGKPERLWGTLNWLRPDIHTGFWGWAAMWYEVFETGYGGRTIGDFLDDRLDDFNKSLGRIMIRRTKAEVSPELPPKQYMDNRTPDEYETLTPAIWLEMTPEQSQAYADMLVAGSAEVAGGTLNALGILAELTRLKQFASCYGEMYSKTIMVDGEPQEAQAFRPILPSNKFEWIVQKLTECSIIDPEDSPTGKWIIVSQFTEILEVFGRRLRTEYGLEPLYITGKVTGAKRDAAQELFNDMNSGYNVLLLNTQAGGVSITLDAADDMVFIDETHVPDDQEQAEDRNNNRRPEEKVATRRYWYLKSLGTIDEAIARVNLHRDQQQKLVLDGRRGVEYMRSIMEQARELAK